jgi:crossover junction endodeoxyribonuclease RuvC
MNEIATPFVLRQAQDEGGNGRTQWLAMTLRYEMKILGIDPGTQVMGWGVIESDGDNTSLVDYGAIKVPDKLQTAPKLHHIFREIQKIIRKFAPDSIAVETPFVGKNVHSAFVVGRAQAMALLAAAAKDIPAFEYSPAKIKQSVANYGASSKEQIQQMVRLLLGLREIPEPSDAADALAVALCHVQESRVNDLLSRQG